MLIPHINYIKLRRETIFKAADWVISVVPLETFALEIMCDGIPAYIEVRDEQTYPLSRINYVTYDGLRLRYVVQQHKIFLGKFQAYE